MTEPELASQARVACSRLTFSNGQKARSGLPYDEEGAEASQYMNTIMLVARKKNGKVPDWFRRMEEATKGSEAEDYEKCLSIEREVKDKYSSQNEKSKKRK